MVAPYGKEKLYSSRPGGAGRLKLAGDLLGQAGERLLDVRVRNTRVGAQQPQGRPGVGQLAQSIQSIQSIMALVVSCRSREEDRYRHAENFGDVLKPSSADPVGALLVFLHLLE